MGSQGEYEMNGGHIDEAPRPAPRDIASQINCNRPSVNDPKVPQWKRAMLDKKRRVEEAKQEEKERQKQEEEDKWKDVPAWKRKILADKEKKKAEEAANEKEAGKGQVEMQAKLAAMPEWKRNIMIKKIYFDKPVTDENANQKNN